MNGAWARPFLMLAAAGLALPAHAAQTREPSLAERYMRVRAAGLVGDLDKATAELAVLVAREPDNQLITQRAYREAIAGGDMALAVKAATILDKQKALPPDGSLLFAVDAIQARDWKRARIALDRVEADKLFAFMVPMLRGWVSLRSGEGDPLGMLETARVSSLAAAYLPAQRAMMLLATGRTDQAITEIRALQAPGSRIRLAGASALQRAHKDADAAAMLAGGDVVFAEARQRLAAGKKIGLVYEGFAPGVSDLFVQVGLDFGRQQLAPVALTLARLATFADPANSGGWIATGNLLGTVKRRTAALAAIDHVKPDDPYASAAQTLRVALLIDAGDKEAALAEAMSLAAKPGAGPVEWSRVGDVYLALEKPGLAATAFERAITLAGAQAPNDLLWPLWLQRGAALEQAGDWARGKTALEKAMAMAPDQPVILNHLGYSMLSRREDVAQATKLIEGANKLRPDDPAITDSLGWARFVGGDARGAVTLLERASAGDPGEPTINEHLGDVYWALGRKIEARYAWRAALVTAESRDLDRIRSKIETAPTPETAAP